MIGTVYLNGKPIGLLTKLMLSPIKANFYAVRLGKPWDELPVPSANASILVSRNEREGRYCGKRPDIEIDPTSYYVTVVKQRHQREGFDGWDPLRARRPA